jgi:hypothetical protein
MPTILGVVLQDLAGVFLAPHCEEEERTDVKNGLYFHAWYGISF